MQPESSKQTSALQAAWIETLSRYHWDLFGTLTFKADTHPEAAFKLFRLFISQINRKLYGPRWSKKGKGIAWCVALERQRRGVVHFHCLLSEPALLELHKASWHQNDSGRWSNELNEMWLKLAGFARVHRIDNLEAVQRYVSKYVIKGGEIDLGGPLSQRTIAQAPCLSIVQPCAAEGPCLGNNSDSVPGLPAHSEIASSRSITAQGSASNLPSIRGCSPNSSDLDSVAQEVSVNEGSSNLPRMISALD